MQRYIAKEWCYASSPKTHAQALQYLSAGGVHRIQARHRILPSPQVLGGRSMHCSDYHGIDLYTCLGAAQVGGLDLNLQRNNYDSV